MTKGERNKDISTWRENLVYLDSEKTTKGENLTQGERYDKGKGSIKNFEHTSRGSKLMNLYGAFEYAFHMFACMTQVLNFNVHACVVYANCRFE